VTRDKDQEQQDSDQSPYAGMYYGIDAGVTKTGQKSVLPAQGTADMNVFLNDASAKMNYKPGAYSPADQKYVVYMAVPVEGDSFDIDRISDSGQVRYVSTTVAACDDLSLQKAINQLTKDAQKAGLFDDPDKQMAIGVMSPTNRLVSKDGDDFIQQVNRVIKNMGEDFNLSGFTDFFVGDAGLMKQYGSDIVVNLASDKQCLIADADPSSTAMPGAAPKMKI
jgi:hypothetical protein